MTNVQNSWEMYRAYMSVSRHVMSKQKGWKYDLYQHGLYENIKQSTLLTNPAKLQMWGNISDAVLEIYPSINRMDIIHAMSMTYYMNNNQFYCSHHSAIDIIEGFKHYKNRLSSATENFKNEMQLLVKQYQSNKTSLKFGLCSMKRGLPDIMYQLHEGKISETTLYILNNMYKASNPNKLTLITMLQNINHNNVFIKMFAVNINMWQRMFEFDYAEISKIYIESHNQLRCFDEQ